MTIYTDQVTGKKYDRVHGGVAVVPVAPQGYKPCAECAFSTASAPWESGEACTRAYGHCVSVTPNKTVFFVFKERKA